MENNNVELLVFIKGQKPAVEYVSPRDFQTYIEGRENSEFEIEIVNNNPFRVEAVLSVDGLSVIDGKPAGDQSDGYLVEARGRVRIPGWLRGNGTAAQFTFTGRKGGTYVEQTTSQTVNKGVIGLMVFAEKHKPYVANNLRGFRVTPDSSGYFSKGLHGLHGHSVSDNLLGGTLNNAQSWTTTSMAGSAMNSAMSASSSAQSASSGEKMKSSTRRSDDRARGIAPEPEQTLGTAYGAETGFQTHTVSFDRGGMHVLMALYYDDKRGLAKRGIEVSRPSRDRYATAPNPFPSRTVGCPAPEGWNP